MKVVGLDGKQYNWSLTGNTPSTNPSSYHLEAREMLKTMFPMEFILEELTLPSCNLRCDFFVPGLRMMVEVHGEEHYRFIAFFHGNKREFLLSQKRDREKREWCRLNNIVLVELKYDERERWERQLRREES